MFTKEQKTAIAARYDAAMKQITQKKHRLFQGSQQTPVPYFGRISRCLARTHIME